MRKLYTTLFVLMVTRMVTAQSTSLTLEQCIDYALKNNITLQNSLLDEQSATAKIKETTGMGLPQVNGNVSVIHNQKLARFFSTYSTNSFFFDGITIPGVNEGDVVAAPNFFQLKSGADAALSIDQLIFSGSYFVGLQAAKTLRDFSVKSTAQSKVGIVENVTKAYYLVVINEQRLLLYENNIARLDTLLRNTSAMNAQGFAESIEVDRLKVSLNNLKTERNKFNAIKSLGVELLKFQMNYPMDQPLTVIGSIESLNPATDINAYNTSWDYSTRADYQVMQTQRELQSLNIRNNYAQALPYISAFANFGMSTQSPTVGGLFKTNTGIESNDQIGPDKWYGYTRFGLSMNVPIFSGMQRHYRIQQEKISLLKIDNSIKQLKSGIDVEIKQALTDYRNGLAAMESQKMNMELAANVARVAKVKYEQGVGSNLELVEAETSLKESQINYYDALFQALISKTDLDKAYGRLVSDN